MENLIHKFLTGAISDAELQELRVLLLEPENKQIFESYIQDAHLVNTVLSNVDSQKAFQKVMLQIQQEPKVRKLFARKMLQYAAIFIGFGIISYLIWKPKPVEVVSNVVAEKVIKTGSDKAILTLANGQQVVLEKGKTYKSNNATSTGEELVYSKDAAITKEEYNTITTPRGGQFQLQLADGTEVWLNSDSKLRYPVRFVGNQRVVELEGEAYFVVTKDKTKRFIVKSPKTAVTVLGTSFNVSAYTDDNFVATTLEEGKVKMSFANSEVQLVPGEQGFVNKNKNQGLEVTTVDTRNFTSWKDGEFYFEHENLESILKKVSRWYNVDFVFMNESLKHKKFTGAVRKSESITFLMNIISKTAPITYKIVKEENNAYGIQIAKK